MLTATYAILTLSVEQKKRSPSFLRFNNISKAVQRIYRVSIQIVLNLFCINLRNLMHPAIDARSMFTLFQRYKESRKMRILSLPS